MLHRKNPGAGVFVEFHKVTVLLCLQSALPPPQPFWVVLILLWPDVMQRYLRFVIQTFSNWRQVYVPRIHDKGGFFEDYNVAKVDAPAVDGFAEFNRSDPGVRDFQVFHVGEFLVGEQFHIRDVGGDGELIVRTSRGLVGAARLLLVLLQPALKIGRELGQLQLLPRRCSGLLRQNRVREVSLLHFKRRGRDCNCPQLLSRESPPRSIGESNYWSRESPRGRDALRDNGGLLLVNGFALDNSPLDLVRIVICGSTNLASHHHIVVIVAAIVAKVEAAGVAVVLVAEHATARAIVI